MHIERGRKSNSAPAVLPAGRRVFHAKNIKNAIDNLGVPVMLLADRFGPSHYYLPFDWYVFILALSYLLYCFFNLSMFCKALFKT